MEIIEKYKKDLQLAFDNKENRIVLNDGPIKARIFMDLLFSNAQSSIEIYSHNLAAEVTEDSSFLISFENILKNKNLTVDIILNTHTDNKIIEKYFQKYIKKEYLNTLSYIKKVDCIKDFLGEEKHFTVIDSEYSRIEHDIDGFKAFSNFSDEQLSKLLSHFFKSLKKECIQ